MANPKIEVEIGARITELDKKLDQVDNKLNQTGKSFKKLNEFAIGALQGIAAAFTIGAVVDFGRAVLDTTAKFQKFSAVLTNTLGSNSAAKIALNEIVDFASKTPFQVDEITGAFVKLANQGFRPTVDQLRSLGDLSASVGASFDQVAEAIIDAQVGEFERLKAFGIRASKEGDNVTFTFKGVETQVKATSSSIRDYILSLGELNGVAGATSAISATVGGQISNLEDNITKLKAAIGDRTTGVFAASLDWLNSFIETATMAVKSVAQIREEVSLTGIGKVIEANKKQVLELGKAYQELDPNITEQAAFAKAIADVSRSYRKAAEFGEDFRKQQYTLGELKQIIEGFNQLSIELLNVSNTTKLTIEQFGILQDIANKKFFSDLALEAETFNNALKEQNRLLGGIADKSEEILKSQSRKVGIFDSEGNLTGKKTIPAMGITVKDIDVQLPDFPPIKEEADNIVTDLQQTLFKVSEEFKAFSGDFLGSVQQLALNINNTIRGGLTNAFANLGNDLGQALATGANVVETIGRSLLNSMGAFLGDLGQQLVAFGVAGFAFTKLIETIKSGSPASIPAAIGAIAAGTAMIAIGSAFRAKAGAGLSGGIGGGRSVSGVGVGGQTFGGSGLESSFINGLEVTGLIEVDGTKLLIALENATKKRNRG